MCNKRKNYSKEFKVMVVEDYLSSKSRGIRQIAIKYDISKEYMVTLWTRKYKANGSDFLGDNRGKAKGHRKGRPKKNMSDMV